MSNDETTMNPRRWTTPAVLIIAVASFLMGGVLASAPSAMADVQKGEQRTTFKDGGIIANETLQESLSVLKRLDERVARIEKALLEVVK